MLRPLRLFLLVLLTTVAMAARAGSITPVQAALNQNEDGFALAASFAIDLGARLEDAVAHGVPLYFTLEFVIERPRKYWINEHVATRRLNHRLSYNSLTRQYRLTSGSLYQNFASLDEALRVLSRVGSLTVAEKDVLKAGETYEAALRLMLDKNQLPKPFQMDAITDKEWRVESHVVRWKYNPANPGSQVGGQ